MRWLGLALLVGCEREVSILVDAPTGGTPGTTLLATLDADGRIEVGGVVSGEVWVDEDGRDDQEQGFRAVVQDAAGETLYARSWMGPLQVRDYLGHYGDESGFDILAGFPMLGDFPVQIPLLESAEFVSLQTRESPETDYVEVGFYDLDNIESDELGTSEAVIGHELLHDAGPSENRLDIVLMGDGYTEAEQELWQADAAALADEIMATEPFAGLAGFINIHRVDAVSTDSGISYDCAPNCEMLDTAFDSVFALNWVNAVLGTEYSTRSIFQLDQWEVARAAAVVPWDVVVIVGNSEAYGGMAVHYATVTTAQETWTSTGVHELAHALGALGDEYVSDACIVSEGNGLPANITDDPESPSWAHWIDAETPLPTPSTAKYEGVVGAFRGAFNCADLYRPAEACRMEDSDGGDFCPVCAEQLSRHVFRYVDPADALLVEESEDRWCFRVETPISGLTLTLSKDDETLATATDDAVCVARDGASGAYDIHLELALDAVLVHEGELSQTFTVTFP